VLILLIAASAMSGFLLGRFFRIFALIPALFVLVAPAIYLGLDRGFWTGILAFVLSATALQVCYFASVMTQLVTGNNPASKTPPESAALPPELGSRWSSGNWLR
jgi:hypothetical protein